jgi:hypothetical protein
MDNNSITEKYNILHKGKKIHQDLTRDEFFDTMEDLAQQFYSTGSPNPTELQTEIVEEI